MFDSPVETVDGNEMEFVHADVFLDLFDTERRSDEFLADRRVDAVEAGILDRRCRYAHVDFLGAGFAQKLADDAARRAADDGIVDHDDALALDDGLDDIQLHADSQFALFLVRLDKGTAHVTVLDEAVLEGDARSLGVADSCRVAAVRDGNDDVRIILRFVPHFPAHVQAGLVDVLAVDDAVRTGEINVFKGTDLLARCLGKDCRFDALFIDLDEFAGLYVADELGTDGVEGTRFRSQDPAAFIGTADAQRAETIGVADARAYLSS